MMKLSLSPSRTLMLVVIRVWSPLGPCIRKDCRLPPLVCSTRCIDCMVCCRACVLIASTPLTLYLAMTSNRYGIHRVDWKCKLNICWFVKLNWALSKSEPGFGRKMETSSSPGTPATWHSHHIWHSHAPCVTLGLVNRLPILERCYWHKPNRM